MINMVLLMMILINMIMIKIPSGGEKSTEPYTIEIKLLRMIGMWGSDRERIAGENDCRRKRLNPHYLSLIHI